MQAEVWAAAIGDLRSLALRRSNETGCRPLSLPLSFRPFCVLLHVWPVMSYVGNESYKRTSAVGAPVAADTKNTVLDTYTQQTALVSGLEAIFRFSTLYSQVTK